MGLKAQFQQAQSVYQQVIHNEGSAGKAFVEAVKSFLGFKVGIAKGEKHIPPVSYKAGDEEVSGVKPWEEKSVSAVEPEAKSQTSNAVRYTPNQTNPYASDQLDGISDTPDEVDPFDGEDVVYSRQPDETNYENTVAVSMLETIVDSMPADQAAKTFATYLRDENKQNGGQYLNGEQVQDILSSFQAAYTGSGNTLAPDTMAKLEDAARTVLFEPVVEHLLTQIFFDKQGELDAFSDELKFLAAKPGRMEEAVDRLCHDVLAQRKLDNNPEAMSKITNLLNQRLAADNQTLEHPDVLEPFNELHMEMMARYGGSE
ncbi:hypothetical protein [Parendozoicomonas haliclonae]|uniref:Uncharacterized protein n=1 Tax=Parendozoicomonas haliclonae TaxID=1960125 RepID=A0A1X7AKJ8_9GAMM|nr:hypothetical protein [Parendozoicomonas haliclonae]SMA47845.1 hypothetical protein EHSB41UT_02566 [Parendozoicomonas haliclonae]